MKTLLSIALALPLSLFSQTVPCVDGFAGEYPCQGYDLVSHLDIDDLGGAANGNDCWGWTDPETGKEYAIMGLSNSTAFVNICDPENPIFLGRLETHSNASLWRDMKVYSNHVYIVSEAGSHGMQVFDLTELRNVETPPVTFQETAHFPGFGNSHNIIINEETGYAYPVGTGFFSGGVHFINIQDPSNPIAEGGFSEDGYTHDAQVVVYQGPDTDYVGKEICFASNADTFTIIDIDDKSDPSQISRTFYNETGYTHQGWLSEDHRFFFMNDEGDENSGLVSNTRTVVWDVTNLDEPFVVEYHIGVSTSIDHNLYVHNGKNYQANYTSGLRVLDFNEDSEDELLSEIGYFDVFPSSDAAVFNGAWSCYPYFESGIVIISSMDRGLFMVKASGQEIEVDCGANGLNENSLQEQVSIFPNPVKDELTLSFESVFEGVLRILDVQGRLVANEQISGFNTWSIDMSALPVGLYLVEVTSEEGRVTKTISKD